MNGGTQQIRVHAKFVCCYYSICWILYPETRIEMKTITLHGKLEAVHFILKFLKTQNWCFSKWLEFCQLIHYTYIQYTYNIQCKAICFTQRQTYQMIILLWATENSKPCLWVVCYKRKITFAISFFGAVQHFFSF